MNGKPFRRPKFNFNLKHVIRVELLLLLVNECVPMYPRNSSQALFVSFHNNAQGGGGSGVTERIPIEFYKYKWPIKTGIYDKYTR